MYLEDAKEDYIEEYQPCKGCIYEGYTSGLCHFCLRNPDRNEFSDHDYYMKKLVDDWSTTDPEEARIEDLHVRTAITGDRPAYETVRTGDNWFIRPTTIGDSPDYGPLSPVQSDDDVVNRPQHYLFGGHELIDIIDALLQDGGFNSVEGFYIATILQYLVRFPKKNGIEDVKKARFYLDRLIAIKNKEEE